MSDLLVSTHNALKVGRTLDDLKASVPSIRPENDPVVRRDLAVNDIVNSTATLLALPRVSSAREIEDLKLVVSRLSSYVLRAEFSA